MDVSEIQPARTVGPVMTLPDLDLIQRVDELVNALHRPLFVFKMARGIGLNPGAQRGTGMERSALSRLDNSAHELDELLRAWVAGESLGRFRRPHPWEQERCSAGIANAGCTVCGVDNLKSAWHLDGSHINHNYDRCRRVLNHRGLHILDCGGGFTDLGRETRRDWKLYVANLARRGEVLFS